MSSRHVRTGPPADIRFEWRSERPSPTEARRAAILEGKPACKQCGIMFHPRYRPPADGLCRDCRRPAAADDADRLF